MGFPVVADVDGREVRMAYLWGVDLGWLEVGVYYNGALGYVCHGCYLSVATPGDILATSVLHGGSVLLLGYGCWEEGGPWYERHGFVPQGAIDGFDGLVAYLAVSVRVSMQGSGDAAEQAVSVGLLIFDHVAYFQEGDYEGYVVLVVLWVDVSKGPGLWHNTVW